MKPLYPITIRIKTRINKFTFGKYFILPMSLWEPFVYSHVGDIRLGAIHKLHNVILEDFLPLLYPTAHVEV
jgi:hypothetical protein